MKSQRWKSAKKKRENVADELFSRLWKIVESSDGDTDLPSEVDLKLPLEVAWEIWTSYVAAGRKFLPDAGALLDQNKDVMNAIFMIDAFLDKVTKQYMGKKPNGHERQNS